MLVHLFTPTEFLGIPYVPTVGSKSCQYPDAVLLVAGDSWHAGFVSHRVSIKGFWKVNSPTNRQPILYHSWLSIQVDGWVGELTFEKLLK